MEQHWQDLASRLLAQQRAGSTIDSVIQVGPRRDDKIIVKGRAGAFRIVPDGLAERAGVVARGGFPTLETAIVAARESAREHGLVAVRARFGKGKDPAGQRVHGPEVVRRPASPPAMRETDPEDWRDRGTEPSEAPTPPAGPPTDVVRAFVSFAREQLRDILDVSGQVLYSGASTLRPGDVYLLGLNPGGDPANPKLLTIRRSLDDLLSDDVREHGITRREWNSYVHATWQGRDTLQRRILWLLAELGHSPQAVAASNLIFPRSRGKASLARVGYADLCWPVHERIIEIVRPRVILTYEGTPYRHLRARFGASREERYPAGHGDWECRSFAVQGRFRVVRVPHMSRYAIDRHPDVVDWIRSL